MAVLDKPGVVLVTRNVYVAVTVVLPRVVALLVTVGAVPVTTTVYIPWLTPVSMLPCMVPEESRVTGINIDGYGVCFLTGCG